MNGPSPARTLGKILAILSTLTLAGSLVAYRQWSAQKALEEADAASEHELVRPAIFSSSKRMTAAVEAKDFPDFRVLGAETLPSSKSAPAFRRTDVPWQWNFCATSDKRMQVQRTVIPGEVSLNLEDVPGFRIVPVWRDGADQGVVYVITNLALEAVSADSASFEVRIGKAKDWTVVPASAADRLTPELRESIRLRNEEAIFSPTYFVYRTNDPASTSRRGKVSLGLPSSKSGPAVIVEFEEDSGGHIQLHDKGSRGRSILGAMDAVKASLKQSKAAESSDTKR